MHPRVHMSLPLQRISHRRVLTGGEKECWCGQGGREDAVGGQDYTLYTRRMLTSISRLLSRPRRYSRDSACGFNVASDTRRHLKRRVKSKYKNAAVLPKILTRCNGCVTKCRHTPNKIYIDILDLRCSQR
jgi:hypothetical protein